MSRIRGLAFQLLHRQLADLARAGYSNFWLMATPLLSQYLRQDFLHRYLTKQPPPRPSCWATARRLLQYLVTSLRFIVTFCGQRKAFLKASHPHPRIFGPLVLIDSVVFTHSTIEKGFLELVEFPGLAEELLAKRVPFLIAPLLDGKLSTMGVQRLARIFAASPVPVTTPFEMLSLADIARLCMFTLFYPLALFRFLFGLGSSDFARMVRHECVDNLTSSAVQSYARYLYGRAISRSYRQGLTVVSKWENRTGDKLFIRGLRSSSAPVSITGAQLYIFPDNYLGAYLTDAEFSNGIAPDRLLVNGPYYLPHESLVPAQVGPSVRYSSVFSKFQDPGLLGNDILVLLGYEAAGVRQSLTVLSQVRWDVSDRMVIRLHPAHDSAHWRTLLPANATLAIGELSENLQHARLVIGSETGTMLEAVACGRPVVNIDALGDLSLRDMPELGRGKIWFPAVNAEDVEQQVAVAKGVLEKTRVHFALAYRKEFFCEPRVGHLLEDFGLDSSN